MSFFDEAMEENQIGPEDRAEIEEMVVDKDDYYEVKNAVEYYFLHLKPRWSEGFEG